MTLYTAPPPDSVVVCLDEMGPDSAKSVPGARLVRTDPERQGRPRARQEIDYGRRGRGYVFGSLVGVLVLGLIKTLITFDGTLSSYWIRIITGALVLVFVVVQRLATRRQT